MLKATYLGGPFDGDIVDADLPELHYLLPQPIEGYTNQEIPVATGPRIGTYFLKHGGDGQYFYVHENLV